MTNLHVTGSDPFEPLAALQRCVLRCGNCAYFFNQTFASDFTQFRYVAHSLPFACVIAGGNYLFIRLPGAPAK